MEQKAATDAASGEDGRSGARESMMLTGTLRRADGSEQSIRVRNLSPGGLMAEVTQGLLKGEPVTVELRGIGTVSAAVAWTSGSRIGMAFDEEVDPRLARRKVTGLPQPMLVRAVTSSWRPAVR